MTRIRHWLLIAVMCFAGTGVTAQTTASLADSQIAHVYYTGRQVDIAAANLALRRSANNAVRAFANATLRDYTAASKTAASPLAKLNINPQDNTISQSLAGTGAEHVQDLSQLSGAAFDKAYAQNELAYHVFLTGALETTLIPSAQNSEVRSLLQSGLALFEQHRSDAAHLASQLMK
jgi:putative membrane protein